MSDTRTDFGVMKLVQLFNGCIALLDLRVQCVHGRVSLRRSENKRHITTDMLEPDEAEHLGHRLIEEARLARAQQAGAA